MTIKTANSSFGGNTSMLSRISARTHLFSPSKIKVTIQLLDDDETISTEFKKGVSGQEILDYVCGYLDIVEKDYFGLRYQDPNTKFRYWVDLTKSLTKQFSSSSLILRFRFRFYPEDPFVLKEEITRYQLFVQLRRDLLHGRLHCSQHESATLAALILQSVLGDYNPIDHPPGYVSQYKLLLKQYDRLEDKIAELHQEFKGMVPSEAETKFLEIASRLDTYGFDPYILKDSKQTQEIIIGVTCRGILIYLKNVKVHFLYWKDVSKVDYFGKQLRIYPTPAYLEEYHSSKDHPPLGDSLLNNTFSDSDEDEFKKKKSKSKKNQFKMTCPSSEFAKHLWKHILSQQVFFTEDQARLVKPKFSKPRIPLLSRGSTFRCPTKKVAHELAQDSSPLRDHQPENFIRYQIPMGPPRADLGYSSFGSVSNGSASKFGTLPAIHIKTRPTVQPALNLSQEKETIPNYRSDRRPSRISLLSVMSNSLLSPCSYVSRSFLYDSNQRNLAIEEERQSLTAAATSTQTQTKTPSSHTPNATNHDPFLDSGTSSPFEFAQSAVTSSPGTKTTISIHLMSTEPLDSPHLLYTDNENDKLFAELRSSTPFRSAETHVANGDINLDESIENEELKKKESNGGVKTNGRLSNGHVPAVKDSANEKRVLPQAPLGKQLASWIFGFILIFLLLLVIYRIFI